MPIVSYVGSATYALALYIKNIISKNITTPKSRVLNSFDLVKKIRLNRIPENHVFASLDALALFTNVPKESAVEAVRKRWNQIINKTKIPWENFEEGLRLCLDSTDFNFKGTTYYQKRWVTNGFTTLADFNRHSNG